MAKAPRKITTNKWLLLVNPTSGGGRSMMDLPEIRKALVAKSIDFDEKISTSAENFLQQLQYAKNYSGLAIAGGDSSLVMALPSAIKTKIPLAFFGSGSQNDIARHLKFQNALDVATAMQHSAVVVDEFIVKSTGSQSIIGGQVNFGLGVGVNRFVERLKKRGPIWYRLQFIAGFYAICRTVLKKITPVAMRIESGGLTFEGEFHIALFTKIKYWAGGFYFAPDAELDNHMVTAVFVRRCSLWRLLRVLLSASSGNHLKMKEVTTIQAAEFTISFNSVQAAQVDGDIWQKNDQDFKNKTYTIQCHPNGYFLHK